MAEFEAAQYRGELGDDDVTGDVKYHHGATGTYRHVERHEDRRRCSRTTPRHLEAVDGWSKASRARCRPITRTAFPSYDAQERRADPHSRRCGVHRPRHRRRSASTCSRCPATTTGGTIHIIANNQIGFTTDPMRRALDALCVGSGQGLRRADRARQRRRRRGVHRGRASWRSTSAASSAATSSST